LQLNGHTCRTSNDGEEAVREAVAFQPDLVLLDIGLPGMDGFEVARRLPREANRPVLAALTGLAESADRERVRQAGFEHHLVKPVQVPALLGGVADGHARPFPGGAW